MAEPVKKIAIIGGGTAGWLTAAVIAAHHKESVRHRGGLEVVLVESSDIPTIGVGEGTWPTLKNTLRDIGIEEHRFFRHCHAAFKQGGKFVGWVHGRGDFYYHPFTVPLAYGRLDIAPYLEAVENFAEDVNFQQHVCEAGLAPRTPAGKEYQGDCNYAYHLDAGAFGELLKQFSKSELGVTHILGTVEDVVLFDDGAIDSVVLREGSRVEADLFVDCTGFSSLLLGKEMRVPFISTDEFLFNDSALVLQVPYANDGQPIACNTIATAQNAGWIWDIGLTHRRGIGHVYCRDYLSDDEAEHNLRRYLGSDKPLEPRKISFKSGYRRQLWKNNCVAVGLSAGFVEPLEATAIMLVEISARFIAEHLPADTDVMAVIAKRFNNQMNYRWQRIVDFLKLHYTLTQRTEPYWRKHRDLATVPESLREDLTVWRSRGPISSDFDSSVELFPSASYQYVIYGMGFKPDFSVQSHLYRFNREAETIVARNRRLTRQLLSTLPPHREYIEQWLAATA